MTDPIIADNQPKQVSLEANKQYAWCACGRSGSQPFCDGSHVGTDFTPTPFSVEEAGAQFVCACKRTGSPPFCDGTHASIDSSLSPG